MTENIEPLNIVFKRNTIENKIRRLLDEESMKYLSETTWMLDKNSWRANRSIRKLFPVA